MSIIINSQTRRLIDNYLKQPGQSLGLFAPVGSGKLFLASYIAEQLLAESDTQDIHIVRPIEKDSITIEQIRELHPLLKQKSSKSQIVARVVIVENADKMTVQAQNALLKKLEEPPSGVVIILTASDKTRLLPTIISRLVIVPVKISSRRSVKDEYICSYDEAVIDKAWLISGGKLGLMSSLLEEPDHRLFAAIDEAKQIIKSTTFERLCRVDYLVKNNYSEVLDGLEILSISGLETSAKKLSVKQTQRWHNIAKIVSGTKQAINSNCNAKLALTNLMLEL